MNRAEFLRVAVAAAAAATVPSGRTQSNEDPTMQQRIIPASGEHLPVIGCGTWRGFDAPAQRRDDLEAVLRELFTAGGSVVDSS